MLLTLVCISNSIDFKACCLSDLGKEGEGDMPETFVFEPYRRDGIESVIVNRVGEGLFDKKSLELIGRKVAAVSGDCRRALELAGGAVGKALSLLPAKEAGGKRGEGDGPLVKVIHVMKAIKENTREPQVAAIAALPDVARMVLCVAVALCGEKTSSSGLTITQGKLSNYCKESVKHGVLDRLSPEDFSDVLAQLSDSGVLDLGNGGNGMATTPSLNVGDARTKLVTLKVQLDDVECALEQSLGDKPFFKQIMDSVRSKHG
jgi:Cdc6-like AAA superfamily ATPase